MPDTQPFSVGYIGGSTQMADGSWVQDLVDDGTARRGFKLTWKIVDDSNLQDILDAFDTLKDGPASYMDVFGDIYSVSKVENGEVTVDIKILANGTMAYDVTMSLIEDTA